MSAPDPADDGAALEEEILSSDEEMDSLRYHPTLKYGDEIEIEDTVRRTVTFGLLGLLTAVAIMAIVFVTASWINIGDMNELLDRVFTPIVALAGTAFGFYFGDRSRTSGRRKKSQK